jgi:hypothetical protein
MMIFLYLSLITLSLFILIYVFEYFYHIENFYICAVDFEKRKVKFVSKNESSIDIKMKAISKNPAKLKFSKKDKCLAFVGKRKKHAFLILYGNNFKFINYGKK